MNAIKCESTACPALVRPKNPTPDPDPEVPSSDDGDDSKVGMIVGIVIGVIVVIVVAIITIVFCMKKKNGVSNEVGMR